jgi:hypothetical protein
MKTTIELPDELLTEAKAAAARRRTTLKAMIEHALKRELRQNQPAADSDACFSIDRHGLPVFKKSGDTVVTSELVYHLMEDLGI